MQNHSAYNVPWTGLDKTVWLTGAMEGRFHTVNQYLSLIRESDSAFQYLVEYFSQVEEPTMILMFGDHQPQVATNFYTEVLAGRSTPWTPGPPRSGKRCLSCSGPTMIFRRSRGRSSP